MKKSLLITLSFFCFHVSQATVFNITVSNFQFSPSSIPNVLVGDIIKFTWSSGSHTTTCDPNTAFGTSLPNGAATWDKPMTSSQTTFSYTVTTVGTYNYLCIPHSSSMTGTFTASSPLPVIISSFKVSNQNNTALINWKTSSEENSKYFSVRKSYTGKDFIEIGNVDAAGSSNSERSYNFVDNIPLNTSHQFAYYLIQIVDKDGKTNFSSTELYKSKIADSKLILSVTPNPVNKGSHIMVDFNSDSNDKLAVSLINLEGKIISQTLMDAHKGVNMGHFHITEIPSGTYTMKFSMKDKIESKIIVVK